ncbi:hypothetical protein HU200_062378 [Digitaria exilis]|uniref:Protein kinase domain-containing protein n=1 Tax=Digitaria exilis TaxID=1010633 RepID=A0A835DVQ8_9POAL|nr:hypothetical protein HU200_062378 [Digitaria exilis]
MSTDRGLTMGREGFFCVLLLITTAAAYSTSVATLTAKSGDAGVISDFTKRLSNPPRSWVRGGDVCSGTFVGITCDVSGRITGINLTDKGLSGTLTLFLSSLGALEILDLRTALPKIIEMDNLPLQPWLIPNTIAKCTALQIFSASNTSIIGALPAELANLKSLTILWLSYNYLRGSLHAWLAELSSLEILGLDNQMSDVKLSGNLDVLGSLKSLKELWIQSNLFSGQIPDFNNSQLQVLNLTDNMLTGLVPSSLIDLESLQSVQLSNNLLQGPWPVFPTGVIVDIVSGNRFCLHVPGPCDPQVSILLDVASGFGFPIELAQTWAGNSPCNGSWVGIVCRGIIVVAINLSGQNLSGFISPAFANLSMLERLDLSKNQLKRVIPKALTILTHLRFLNVSNNDLSGLVPRFNSRAEVVTEGNPLLSPNSKSNVLMIGVIVGSTLAGVVILLLLAWLCLHIWKKRNASGPALETQVSTHMTTGTIDSTHQSLTTQCTDAACQSLSHVEKLPINVLTNATNNFDENMILGKGGSAVVFKGVLNDEPVAVKRFNSDTMSTKQAKEFINEIDVVGKLSHRNLVKLLGYCIHNNERLLVYEYMPAGTLWERLKPSDHMPLTWAQRMMISLDVARGIEYLHGMNQQAFIRDLKPSNILLDQDLRAKVSDFGLIKTAENKSSTSSKAVGTFGYLAPEYAGLLAFKRNLNRFSKSSAMPSLPPIVNQAILSPHAFKKYFALSYFSPPLKDSNLYKDLEIRALIAMGELSTKVDVFAYGVVLMEIITGRKAIDESLPDDGKFLAPIFKTKVLDKEKFRDIVDPALELNDEDWDTLLEVADLAHHCTALEPRHRPGMHNCVTILSNMVDQWKPTVVGCEKGETSSMGLNQLVDKWIEKDLTTSGWKKEDNTTSGSESD